MEAAHMDSRMAIIGIFVYDRQRVEQINNLLHENRMYIVGRMGLPYQEKDVSVISIILDAPRDKIQLLSEKLDLVPDVQVQTLYSKADGQ